MTENVSLDRIKELKARLQSFDHQALDASPEVRIAKIQEDIVVVASWANSPEVKQIDSDLRRLYFELTASSPLQTEKRSKDNGARHDSLLNRIPAWNEISTHLKSRIPSFRRYSKAFGLSLLTLFIGFGSGIAVFVLISPSQSATVFFLIFAIGYWASLFVFFRVAAPGVKFRLKKANRVSDSQKAGPWLGILGGIGVTVGMFLTTLGLIIPLPTFLEIILVLLVIIGGPVIGVLVGVSISSQAIRR